MKTLPDLSKERLKYPISGGCLAYFPAALAGVSKHSYIGGAKYNNGGLVHLRYVSTQHMDCIQRHLMDLQDLLAARERGVTHVLVPIWNFEEKAEVVENLPIEEAILIECNALAWRSLATSQELHEKLGGAPLAPAARLEPEVGPSLVIRDVAEKDKTVAMVKALRSVTDCSLKDALDTVRGSMPTLINLTPGTDVLHARKILTDAGFDIK